ELGIHRRAEARGNALSQNLDHRSARRAGLAHAIEVLLEEFGLLHIRTEKGISADLIPIPARPIDLVRTHLNQRAAHDKAGYDLARDRSGGHPRRRLARRRPPAAAIIVDAVFDVIRI